MRTNGQFRRQVSRKGFKQVGKHLKYQLLVLPASGLTQVILKPNHLMVESHIPNKEFKSVDSEIDEMDMIKGLRILPASVFTDDGPLDASYFGGGWDWWVDTAEAVRNVYRVVKSLLVRC
jgi:hypothetical protein